MKVRDIMTKDVKCCALGTNLAAASELMWNNDCGVLPVTEDGKVTGIITDRDICIALGTRNRPAAEVAVQEVATHDVQTCAPDADVHTAMAVMRRAKVRRLPVVDDGKVEGILALNDIIEAVDRKHGDINYEEVMNTIKAVSEHRMQKRAAAASAASSTFPPIPVAVA
jgi:CBS domain-containing protein